MITDLHQLAPYRCKDDMSAAHMSAALHRQAMSHLILCCSRRTWERAARSSALSSPSQPTSMTHSARSAAAFPPSISLQNLCHLRHTGILRVIIANDDSQDFKMAQMAKFFCALMPEFLVTTMCVENQSSAMLKTHWDRHCSCQHFCS
jgi:hypothetical protein